jgi:pimeloyl-ACP methyl ester carboxylesterase
VQLITPLDDAFLSERLYDDLDRWVPRLTRRTLPAKHWIPRTRPDQLSAWITEFVRSAESGRPEPVKPTGKYADRFGGQLVLVTGAGHMLMQERPRDVTHRLASLARKVR